MFSSRDRRKFNKSTLSLRRRKKCWVDRAKQKLFEVSTTMTVDYEIKVWSFLQDVRWEISFAIPSVRWFDVAASILTSIAHVTRVHNFQKWKPPDRQGKASLYRKYEGKKRDKFSKRKQIACLGIYWTIKKQFFKSFPPISEVEHSGNRDHRFEWARLSVAQNMQIQWSGKESCLPVLHVSIDDIRESIDVRISHKRHKEIPSTWAQHKWFIALAPDIIPNSPWARRICIRIALLCKLNSFDLNLFRFSQKCPINYGLMKLTICFEYWDARPTLRSASNQPNETRTKP